MDALSEQVLITSALDYASGTADRPGAALDMAGFDGVLMGVKFAAIATGCTTSIKAQCHDDASFGSPSDIEGTAITVADSDDEQIFLIDIVEPPQRYVRVYVDKDTSNASGEMAWYVQYKAKNLPQSNNVTDKVTCELHVAPVVGTA